MSNEELLARLEKVERELTRTRDIVEIQRLQSRYMYYLETSQMERIWDELFTHTHPDVAVEMVDNGRYEGPEAAKSIWYAIAKLDREMPPQPGIFPMLFVATPLVVVGRDGTTARGQWHVFGPHSMYVHPYPGDQKKLTAYWFGGKYDNKFVKEDGKWKFLELHAIAWIRSPYEEGWVKNPDCRRTPMPPGAPPTKPYTTMRTYHPDAIYTVGGVDNWGPLPPDEEE